VRGSIWNTADDDVYLVAYDAVCESDNKQHLSFNQYQLPHQAVLVVNDEIETANALYSLTPTEEWTQVDEDDGRTMDPNEWTGGDEEC
jgi:hypothetical protein